jgi:hypothetical protein
MLDVSVAWFKCIEFECTEMIVLPRIRDAIVYVIPHGLLHKGNMLLGVGMVLWDAKVYVRPRALSLFFS